MINPMFPELGMVLFLHFSRLSSVLMMGFFNFFVWLQAENFTNLDSKNSDAEKR